MLCDQLLFRLACSHLSTVLSFCKVTIPHTMRTTPSSLTSFKMRLSVLMLPLVFLATFVFIEPIFPLPITRQKIYLEVVARTHHTQINHLCRHSDPIAS
jgi:hypothetical protein